MGKISAPLRVSLVKVSFRKKPHVAKKFRATFSAAFIKKFDAATYSVDVYQLPKDSKVFLYLFLEGKVFFVTVLSISEHLSVLLLNARITKPLYNLQLVLAP